MHTKPVHLVLVGFMGSGKTCTAASLSTRLGIPWVDLDAEIEALEQRTVTDIFADKGEVGFRAIERKVLRGVLEEDAPHVIALGGGTFVDAAMRKMIKSRSSTVYLSANLQTLTQRLSQPAELEKRPLLDAGHLPGTIEHLLKRREASYQSADHVVVVDGLTVEQVADCIERTLREPTSTTPESSPVDGGELCMVRTGTGQYPICVYSSIDEAWIKKIRELVPYQRLFILSDENVWHHHGASFSDALQVAGIEMHQKVVVPGEGSKSLATAEHVYQQLSELGWSRRDPLISIGGGVVGDLGGFVASTYARGIPFIQCPSTTLSIADSSVGGKTGINLPLGKNLVGTFYPPKAVLVCLDVLSSLSDAHYRAGLAEVAKAGLIRDAALVQRLLQRAEGLQARNAEALIDVMLKAIQVKTSVVQRDEYEAGERAVLNYGHTIGHVFEACSGYRMLHGEAVSLGMVAEARFADAQGWSRGVGDAVVTLLQSLNLPTDWEGYAFDGQVLAADKKRESQSIRMPILSQPGHAFFRSIPISDILEFMRSHQELTQ